MTGVRSMDAADTALLTGTPEHSDTRTLRKRGASARRVTWRTCLLESIPAETLKTLLARDVVTRNRE